MAILGGATSEFGNLVQEAAASGAVVLQPVSRRKQYWTEEDLAASAYTARAGTGDWGGEEDEEPTESEAEVPAFLINIKDFEKRADAYNGNGRDITCAVMET